MKHVSSSKAGPANEPSADGDDEARRAGVARAHRMASAVEMPSDIALAAYLHVENVDWDVFRDDLRAATEKLRRNDLSHVEDMLMQQAAALQVIFTRMAQNGLLMGTSPTVDMFLRHALKAQAQCRATLETLAAVKNPPAVYARQANVTTGPQQINNKVVLAAAAGRESHELSANREPPALAGPGDPPMATVGTIDGAAHRGRQGEVVAQCVEGRGASADSPPRPNAS